MSTVVAFRINPEELAKALDGLISEGTPSSQLTTISNIVRTTFYYGIIHLCGDPKEAPSRKSLQKIIQLTNQNKKLKSVGIKDLLKEGE
ncbi:MAG: hypothetical protein SVO01_00645 [Thermotogota bacterium]|nr:hypothetical protein [Thermotogota bacterium]